MKFNIFLGGLVMMFLIVNCREKKSNKSATGVQIFKENCVVYHGVDGKLGLNGAKDLTKSSLSIDEKKLQVKEGKGLMTPFKNILTENEIELVVNYVQTLKN